MDKKVCGTLISISNSIYKNPGEKGEYQFTMNHSILNGYCNNNICSNNFEKINAGCLYLLDAFFKDSKLFESVAKSNIKIVEYIMIWLSKMLSRIENTENQSLQFFYDIYINGDNNYKKPIEKVIGCSNYKELIDKTNMMNMKIKDISKLYDAFTTLCMMHYEFNEQTPNCDKYLNSAKIFVDQYKKLKGDSNITENSSYDKILYTLSKDYDNFKNKCSGINCSNISSFPSIEITNNAVLSSQQFSEDTSSSSSISKNLFIVLSIFGAIGFFLGISYKYSLFGFRKRFQKQKLREKLKNIKKRMNH
ncbi:PIR protein [Plasmodium yoelii]|uniref:PIR protein n=3 Tax=Plasmodium yoelii TaxID=5861 RepID=A0AAE9WRB6_PLAYO|nr:PIR protein [Plasmodium yoelii]WBY55144.1 PIR protein [Plasmodium yoelii yoelii]VTZ72749.1 PIR protein [Plasmodium yoelii]|eukprot:XP_022811064.1 PIR protein [Plasmodium yoelii]